MMRRRRLLLLLLLAACIVAGAVFAVRGRWFAQLTGGGLGETQADGYLVQLTEPPLLARENVAQKYRALALADRQRRVMKAKAAGKETSVQTATIRSLDLQITSNTATLQAAMEPERMKLSSQQQSVRAAVNALLVSGGVPSMSAQGVTETEQMYSMAFNGFFLPVSRLTAEQIVSIEQVPGVKKVYPNSRIHASLDTSVPAINAPPVWGLNASGAACTGGNDDCITGQGIHIGILDSGVDYTHPDFGGCNEPGPECKVRWGHNYVTENGVGIPAEHPEDPMDDYGHGTHVAAIAAGKASGPTGLNGVAPGAEIYAYKVLDHNGGGNGIYLAAAINDLMGWSTYTAPMVDIVNMSLDSCTMHDPNGLLSQMADIMVSVGVNVIVAAGNSWSDPECMDPIVTEPGAAWNVITVGGSNDAGVWDEEYSRYGPVPYGTGAAVKPDVLAPGRVCAAKSRLSSFNSYCNNDYSHVSLFGTSMATPHVAGVAALMLQAHPDMTPDVLKQTLRDSTFGSRDFKPMKLKTSGYGMVDALAATFASPHQPVRLTALNVQQSGDIPRSGITLESNIGDIPWCASYRVLLAASDGSGCQQGVTLTQSNVCRSGMLLSLEPDTLWKNNVYFFLVLEVTDTSGRISRDALAVMTTFSMNTTAPSCFGSSSSSSSPRSSSSLSSSALSSSSISASSSAGSVGSFSSAASSSPASSSSHSSSLHSSSLASSSQSSWTPCDAGYLCTRTQSNQGGVLQCLASSLASCTPEWNGDYCGSPSCLGECYRCLSSSSTAPSSAPSSSRSSSRSSVASSGPHTCGNALVEPTEQCDDGNRASGDGCSSTCQAECIDTDGGPDYNVKGTTKSTWRSNPLSPLRWTSRTDSCQGNVLTEFLCSAGPDTRNAIAGRAVTCKKGCSNGACAR